MLIGKILFIAGLIGLFSVFALSLILTIFEKNKVGNVVETALYGISSSLLKTKLGKVITVLAVVFLVSGVLILTITH